MALKRGVLRCSGMGVCKTTCISEILWLSARDCNCFDYIKWASSSCACFRALDAVTCGRDASSDFAVTGSWVELRDRTFAISIAGTSLLCTPGLVGARDQAGGSSRLHLARRLSREVGVLSDSTTQVAYTSPDTSRLSTITALSSPFDMPSMTTCSSKSAFFTACLPSKIVLTSSSVIFEVSGYVKYTTMKARTCAWRWSANYSRGSFRLRMISVAHDVICSDDCAKFAGGVILATPHGSEMRDNDGNDRISTERCDLR